MTQHRLDPTTARHELTDHRFYRYRGCAPDPDDPRMAAGDPELSVDAWQAPDTDGGEEQEARQARVQAAKAVCARCPVLAACAVYGASVTEDGRLAERHAILGGLTALERTKALVEERQEAPVRVEPAPVEQLRTEQKLAVLKALARFEEPELIAAAANVDVRTAKWQISRLTTQLGLEKTATRVQLLEAAVARGLLDRGEVAAAGAPVVASLPSPSSSSSSAGCRPVSGARRRGGRRIASVRGQLSFDDALAPVTSLFPKAPLEAAA